MRCRDLKRAKMCVLYKVIKTDKHEEGRFLKIGVKESQLDGIPIYLGFSLRLLIGRELTAAGISANKHASAKWQLIVWNS